MVARESAAVTPARPTFLQVVTRQDTPWMNTIRESGSVIVAEFNQVATHATLGAGGAADSAIIGGVEKLADIVRITGTIGSRLDGYSLAGMAINYGEEMVTTVENATGIDTPVGDVASAAKDVYGFVPGLLTSPVGTDWRAPVAP